MVSSGVLLVLGYWGNASYEGKFTLTSHIFGHLMALCLGKGSTLHHRPKAEMP